MLVYLVRAEPDARLLYEAKEVSKINKDIVNYLRYFNVYPAEIKNVEQVTSIFKPYKYGHITEISLDKDGKPKVGKHFAMGRLAFEMALVLPDNKTVLLSDDGSSVMHAAFGTSVSVAASM